MSSPSEKDDASDRPFAHDTREGQQVIVFLHGLGASHAAWRSIAERLRSTHRLIAYDLPGHGKSLGFAGRTTAKAASCAILDDLARRGVESAHVVGHSLGGAVATLMALTEASRVKSLILLAPGGYGPEINGTVLQRYARATTAGELSACLAAMSAPGTTVSHQVIEILEVLRSVPGQTEKLTEIAEAISRDDRQGSFPADWIARLLMPVAVVWGTLDPILPFSQTIGLPAHFRLTPVEGAGHMLIEEAPEAVLRVIREGID